MLPLCHALLHVLSTIQSQQQFTARRREFKLALQYLNDTLNWEFLDDCRRYSSLFLIVLLWRSFC